MSLKLAWGIQPPEGVPVAYGARAIYSLDEKRVRRNYQTIATIDIVHDRQSLAGDPKLGDGLRKALRALLPALKKACEDAVLDKGSRDELVVECEGYTLHASPRASHGYLYIGAWPTPAPTVH